jgi:hypothetical protein
LCVPACCQVAGHLTSSALRVCWRITAQVATNPQFDACRADIDYLADQIRAIESELLEWEASGEPLQLGGRGSACRARAASGST